jgi:predicted nucleic acid-binding protein
MTAVLLDTSAYAAHQMGHPDAVAAVRDAGEVCLNAVVLGELLDGFQRGSQPARNLAYLRKFLAEPRSRLLPIDGDTADRYASILGGLRKAGTPIPTHDVWIAASAMQHGLVLLTADAHFERVAQVRVRCFATF